MCRLPTASSPFQSRTANPLGLFPVIVIPNLARPPPNPPTKMRNPARHRRHHPLLCALLFVSIAASAASAARGPIAFATITTKTAPIATGDGGAAAMDASLSSIPGAATTGRSARRVPITASYTGPTAFATISARTKAAAAQHANAAPADNPFSAKAALIRYWTRKIPNGQSKPAFLLSKASPLSAADAALYERLAAQRGGLTERLRSFCSAAALFCFPELAPTLDREGGSANFAVYSSKDFSNYGTGKAGGLDSFKNYSENENVPIDSFRRYSRGSTGHADRFTRYAPNGNVVTANFTSYATGAVGGSGDFTSYDSNSNVPDLKFTNYDADADGRVQSFNSYSDDTNAGDQSFTGYGKRGLGIPLTFKSYGTNSNVIGSTFRNYGESATSANDTFTNYGFNGNVPENRFSSYGDGGHGASETFTSYRDQSNVGDDSFTSYAKGSTGGASASFARYGQSFNLGSDTFTGYGQNAVGKPSIDFKTYGFNNTFKDYADKKSVSFQQYNVSATSSVAVATTTGSAGGSGSKRTTNRWVEPGRFFRESMLKPGTVMPMPDIRDRMPRRAFLPRSIAEKLPFSTSRLGELNQLFNATTDSALGKAMSDTVAECERAPSRGETKRCATSVEDMIDLATSILGENVVVRSTESTAGSGGSIVVGAVRGVDGGRETRSVSCHQSLFPYMVYYCHAVPKVRVYEADIHDAAGSRPKINHGVAICHLDTSDWSAGHGAFVALGSSPGKIEVCHWIFQGDMTWTVAD
ncbi:hypothetical protein Taro_029922 [Colocasia esculenta]|uniref:BURP domain-containing protein n=1 Tax=Colocasia esculenta TaxID=4460 RepID=A0A843VMM4_COLES|nr:hypothetical protein [Colocasia esculenta]